VGQRQGAVAGPDQVGPEHDGQVRRRHLKKTRQKTVNPSRVTLVEISERVFSYLPGGIRHHFPTVLFQFNNKYQIHNSDANPTTLHPGGD
jgi:hypothetical protein